RDALRDRLQGDETQRLAALRLLADTMTDLPRPTLGAEGRLAGPALAQALVPEVTANLAADRPAAVRTAARRALLRLQGNWRAAAKDAAPLFSDADADLRLEALTALADYATAAPELLTRARSSGKVATAADRLAAISPLAVAFADMLSRRLDD